MYVCIVCCEWLCVFGVEWGGLRVVREDGRRWEEMGGRWYRSTCVLAAGTFQISYQAGYLSKVS